MIKSITYPRFILSGIRANHRAYPVDHNLKLFAGDTETCRGRPMTLQLHDDLETLFAYVDPKTILPTFLDWTFDRCRTKGVNICYYHFLRFDLPVLFYQHRRTMYEQVCEIEFDTLGYEINILFGKVNKAEIRKGNKKLILLDSFAFTGTSLAKSLSMYKIPYSKHDKPERIGNIDYRSLDSADPERIEFEAYAKNDVVSLWHLGKSIMDFHQKYGVRPCISLPQFASRVFRHHFMDRDDIIAPPPAACMKASELSYHGGKNGFYLDRPTVIEDLCEVDISSAYPFAMRSMPQMLKGFYGGTRRYIPGLLGIYKISGEDRGKYPLVFDHQFSPVRGKFKDLWTTGYELGQMLRKGSAVTITELSGWVWHHDKSFKRNPLADYVDEFYRLKQSTPKSDPNYTFYKVMLNALYGKFIQTTEIRKMELVDSHDTNDDRKLGLDYVYDKALQRYVRTSNEWRAGGLYNPFLATQITGFVRAYIYDLEVKHKAVHTATDSIKTTRSVPAISGLGGLKVEVRGRCYIFRNKLYLHFAKDFTNCNHTPDSVKIWDGSQHLCKFALHGYKGTVEELFANRHRLMHGGKLKYKYQHMVGLREGFRRQEDICAMVDREEELCLR